MKIVDSIDNPIKGFTTTKIDKPTVSVDPNSTFLNPKVKTLRDLKDWVLVMLGYPLITVELTDEQLNVCVQNALQKYTKYAFFPDKFLVVKLNDYKKNVGLNLSQWRVTTVKDMATCRESMFGMGSGDLFFGWPAFLNGMYGGSPFFGGSNHMNYQNWSGGFVSYHNFIEFAQLAKRITGSNPDYRFDRTTQCLLLIPEPSERMLKENRFVLLTVECEPTLEELYSNEYVQRLVLAYAKILLGTVRKKFSSVQLVGGGQIDTSIGDEGREELNNILENIRADEAKGNFFFIM